MANRDTRKIDPLLHGIYRELSEQLSDLAVRALLPEANHGLCCDSGGDDFSMYFADSGRK
jgi:hypothetical protein